MEKGYNILTNVSCYTLFHIAVYFPFLEKQDLFYSAINGVVSNKA